MQLQAGSDLRSLMEQADQARQGAGSIRTRSPSASHFRLSLGSFNIRKFFMSAAMRSCSAFLMSSDRIDPGGNFFACARACDARAVTRQFCHVTVLAWMLADRCAPSGQQRTLSGRRISAPHESGRSWCIARSSARTRRGLRQCAEPPCATGIWDNEAAPTREVIRSGLVYRSKHAPVGSSGSTPGFSIPMGCRRPG